MAASLLGETMITGGPVSPKPSRILGRAWRTEGLPPTIASGLGTFSAAARIPCPAATMIGQTSRESTGTDDASIKARRLVMCEAALVPSALVFTIESHQKSFKSISLRPGPGVDTITDPSLTP